MALLSRLVDCDLFEFLGLQPGPRLPSIQPHAEIRLFTMRQNELSDSISIDVEVVRLNAQDLPQFVCISYVWGPPHARRNIDYNGQTISITTSLWDALQRLRVEFRSDVRYWADQISIRQKITSERNAQVRLMSKIFQGAYSVVCWLGEEDASTKRAFAALGQWESAENLPTLRDELFRAYSSPPQSKSETQLEIEHSLRSLLNRQWWRRVWTLQEVYVPRNNEPIVLCGGDAMGWYSLYIAWAMLLTTLGSTRMIEMLGVEMSYANEMFEVHFHHSSTRVPLSDFLSRALVRDVTDEKDRVFAMLGMTDPGQVLYPAPNYHLSLDEVNNIYTRAMIRAEDNLNAISFGRIAWPASQSFSSWAFGRGRGTEMIRGVRHLPESVTGNTRPMLANAKSSFDPALRLRGKLIGHIRSLHGFRGLVREDRPWQEIVPSMVSYTSRLELPEIYERTADPLAKAVLQTVLTDNFYVGCSWDTRKGQYSRELYHAFRQHRFGTSDVDLIDDSDCRLLPRSDPRWLDGNDCLYKLARSLFSFDSSTIDCEVLDRGAESWDDIQPSSSTLEWLEHATVKQLAEAIDTHATEWRLAVVDGGLLALVPLAAEIGDEVW